MENYKEVTKCIETIKRLRDPESGCPWDLEQTHESLAKYIIEEAYELVAAVESGDKKKIKDELGDIFLQVLLHSVIAEQEDCFSIEDVAKNLNDKMIRRHPHVFGEKAEGKKTTQEELQKQWEKIKKEEHQQSGETLLGRLQECLKFPGLMAAQKIGKEAKKFRFDWENHQQVLYKVEEEWQELKTELPPHGIYDHKAVEEEFGDLLFSLAHLGRHLKLDSESSLRKACQKFVSRVELMDEICQKKQKNLHDCSEHELATYWAKVKAKEKSSYEQN